MDEGREGKWEKGSTRMNIGRKGLDILAPVRKVEEGRKVLDYGVRSENWDGVPFCVEVDLKNVLLMFCCSDS